MASRQWRWAAAGVAVLSATSCGYAVGDFVGINACIDHNGHWEKGVCYDSGGSLSSLPHGWQAINPHEISAVTGHAKDWGVLEPGAVDLDGDGAPDLARILVDPSMTQFRLFVFYGKDDLAGDRAVALTEAQRVADVAGVSVSVEGPPGEPDRAPKITLRRTIEGERRDMVFAWRGDRLAEVAP
ncbi:MAG: hypothetical protein Q8L83_05525 [Phenylobacterium sp.]|uniref:hypothetical protein n=1 Tax=Phenylobacterium sp. TaxID=1871053 RepID=UPI002731B4C2|nr:hypothetical protein [Phenylobacterium sp.]MDP1616794.1 hypothetical protein [Phenylobacterium sp.]MDP1986265.1 hypothetical protein [Phenylobacterium sp.]